MRRTTPLLLPRGKKKGCLPRVSRPGKLAGVPLFRDHIEVIPESEWPKYYGRNGVKSLVWDILDQDGVGSCAAECVAQAVMILREFAGLDRIKLNPWSMYRITSNGVDRGSTIEGNVRQAARVGILPQSYWPRSHGWRARPPADWEAKAARYRLLELEAFDVTTKAEFGTALIKRYPVVYGRDRHAICGVELKPDGVAFANSWDESWNGDGFGFDRWSAILRSIRTYGAIALRAVVHPSHEAGPPLPA